MAITTRPRKFHFRVPASSANLGPGYDTLGLALTLYLEGTLIITPSRIFHCTITNNGRDAASLPTTHSTHLLTRAFFGALGTPPAAARYDFDFQNQIPIGKGLGSSGAAIVAGIVLARKVNGLETETEKGRGEAFKMALKWESNPDNVGASLFGGFVSCTMESVGRYANRIAYTPIMVVPEERLSTEASRKVLPEEYSKEDVVFNIQRLAQLPIALMTGSPELRTAMDDKLHQQYRLPLIPKDVRGIVEDPELPSCISGAGSSVLVFALPDEVDRVAYSLRQRATGAEVLVLDVDSAGPTVREEGDP